MFAEDAGVPSSRAMTGFFVPMRVRAAEARADQARGEHGGTSGESDPPAQVEPVCSAGRVDRLGVPRFPS